MTLTGSVLLVIVLVSALVGAGSWATTLRNHSPQLTTLARWVTVVPLAATVAAVAIVETALIRNDTRLNYVTMVSGPDLPLYYRITSLWSALEGSLLLWLLALTLVAGIALFRPHRHTTPVGRAVMGLTLNLATSAFAVISLMASPFAISDDAVAARPSPLLQDHVAMGLHPPLLYAGFLALAVPYALALAGLVTRQMDAGWATRMRNWTLVAWALLTAGIMLGAWWSYAVLGWGGYWAWDPVENASLLPWLTATALLHAVAPRTRRGAWRFWAAGMAGASFILVLLATFLTRSGFVESIHAFTTSQLGPTLLAIVVAALIPWVVLMHVRRRDLAHEPNTALLSRTSALAVNRVLLVLITLVVLVGTILPSVLLAVTGERLSVGPPWYHRTLAPLALILLLAMAVGPWLPTNPARTHSGAGIARRISIPAFTAVLTLGAVAWITADVWFAICCGLGVFTVISLAMTLMNRRRRDRLAVGAWIAHTGIALGAVGVLGSGLGTVTQESVPVGGTVVADDTTVTVIGLDGRDEGRRTVASAQIALGTADDFVAVVEPELRYYPVENTMLAGPEIRSELLRDVYVTLLEVDEEAGLVTIRLAINPMVSWIWGASALLVIGAAVAGWPKRRRHTAAQPSTAEAASTDVDKRHVSRQEEVHS